MTEKVYLLTPNELVFCAACVGIYSIFGVTNEWTSAGTDCFEEETEQIMAEIEKKGYGMTSFSEGFSLDAQFAQALIFCGNAEQKVLAELRDMRGNKCRNMLYMDDNQCFSLCFDGATYSLCRNNEEFPLRSCLKIAEKMQYDRAEGEAVVLSADLLTEALRETRVEDLRSCGCSAQMAELLTSDSIGSFLYMVILKKRMDSFMTFFTEQYGVRVQGEYALEGGNICLTPISSGEAYRCLKKIVRSAEEVSGCQTL